MSTPATNAAELCSAMPESYLVRYSGATGAQTSDAHEGEPRMNNHTSASFVPSPTSGLRLAAEGCGAQQDASCRVAWQL